MNMALLRWYDSVHNLNIRAGLILRYLTWNKMLKPLIIEKYDDIITVTLLMYQKQMNNHFFNNSGLYILRHIASPVSHTITIKLWTTYINTLQDNIVIYIYIYIIVRVFKLALTWLADNGASWRSSLTSQVANSVTMENIHSFHIRYSVVSFALLRFEI